jgi:uncharacterized protein
VTDDTVTPSHQALTDCRRIATVEELRHIIGNPAEVVQSKIASALNPLTRMYAERSPFVCLATTDADGNCDVTPRGDPRGFVRILDDRTLLMPERPGNRLADALRNIIATGHVGMLFFIPGVGDTFRVNGRAWLTDDEALLAPSSLEGKVPKLGVVIEIDECFTQCPKAFIRSALWDPVTYQATEDFPTGGEILQVLNGAEFDAAAYDQARAARYARREGMY